MGIVVSARNIAPFAQRARESGVSVRTHGRLAFSCAVVRRCDMLRGFGHLNFAVLAESKDQVDTKGVGIDS